MPIIRGTAAILFSLIFSLGVAHGEDRIRPDSQSMYVAAAADTAPQPADQADRDVQPPSPANPADQPSAAGDSSVNEPKADGGTDGSVTGTAPAEPGDTTVQPEKKNGSDTDTIQPPGDESQEVEPAVKEVADPLEPFNRAMFTFNDKLYFWALKPLSQAYNFVFPEFFRIGVRNAFSNASMPVRFVSSLLQLKFKSAGIELARFIVNTTIGIGGLFDIAAREDLQLMPQDSDTGLMLGHYGLGEGIFITWPFLGPSNLRDTVGSVGDSFLIPWNYINPIQYPIGASAYERVNKESLRIGDYEDLVNAAVDPYTAVKDAYIQNRRSRIK